MSDSIITSEDLYPFVGGLCMTFKDGNLNTKLHIEGFDLIKNKVICSGEEYDHENVLPILRKLEDITIEETVFISCNIMGYDRETEEDHIVWNDNDKRMINEFGFFQFEKHDSIFMPKVMQYLINKGFNTHILPEGTYAEIDNNGVVDISNTLRHEA